MSMNRISDESQMEVRHLKMLRLIAQFSGYSWTLHQGPCEAMEHLLINGLVEATQEDGKTYFHITERGMGAHEVQPDD